ncbi:alba protein C9orf23-like [Tropilaelaps mercedesae]|uniref:Alba protein C9orf23-like n=1 Tax=Tropilaelaps mercedesae TaxID=418985 RepID=A0A1V9XV51_9ACAR|nr:alba protein C9orf23-like [Tropilaelaps mercedesae]
MEKYDRGEIIDQDVNMPFPASFVDKDVPQLRVQAGSKIRNLLDFAFPAVKDKQQLVIVGCGPAISKVITVTEMLKRKERGLDQWNKIGYKQVLEYWEPKEEGMFRLQVTREIPVIHVLLSKTPLDASLPGVQKAMLKPTKQYAQKTTKGSKWIVRATRMENKKMNESTHGGVGKVGPGNTHIERRSGFKEPKDRSERRFNSGTENNRRAISSLASKAAKNRFRGYGQGWNRRPSDAAVEKDIETKETSTPVVI